MAEGGLWTALGSESAVRRGPWRGGGGGRPLPQPHAHAHLGSRSSFYPKAKLRQMLKQVMGSLEDTWAPQIKV